MMYAVYRLSDGVVVKHVVCPPRHLARNTPDGCAAIEGEVDAQLFKVDPETRQLIARGLPQSTQEELDEHVKQLAREKIAAIEAGQVRTIREALLGDAGAIERLREQEPAIAAARSVLRQPRPSSGSSAPSPPEPAPPSQE